MKKLFLKSLNLLSAGLMMLLLTSCANTSEQPIRTQIVEKTIIKPQRPASIQPVDISYITVTRNTMEEDITSGQAYMCLSWQDYLTLAQWEQDKLRYIKQSNKVIDYYEETLDDKETNEKSPTSDNKGL